MPNKPKLILFLLLAVFLVLGGVFVYKDLAGTQSKPIATTTTVPSPSGQVSPPPAPAASPTSADNSEANNSVPETQASALARLKTTQDLIAANPWPDQTKMKAYSSRIDKLAVDSNRLEINYCAPNPGVLHLKIGQSFVLKNSDSVFHKLYAGKLVFQAPAHSEQRITPAFPSGDIYSFRCDVDFAGIIWVTP